MDNSPIHYMTPVSIRHKVFMCGLPIPVGDWPRWVCIERWATCVGCLAVAKEMQRMASEQGIDLAGVLALNG